jgi:AcrR family transcriptional regulator
LEGFRTRDVASAAGIDTGTLHYHFPSKEALIQAVVAHLLADFQIVRAEAGPKPEKALDELRNEIRDAAIRVKESPDQIRVMFDLRARTSRDPVIAAIMAKVDQAWHQSASALLDRFLVSNAIKCPSAVGA